MRALAAGCLAGFTIAATGVALRVPVPERVRELRKHERARDSSTRRILLGPSTRALVAMTTLLLVAAATLSLPLAAAIAIAGVLAPPLRRRRAVADARRAFDAGLPEVVDLLAVAVSAGMTVHLAVEAVARRAGGPLGSELRRVIDATNVGARLADALDELPPRAGEGVRPLAAALASCERYGAPVLASLERVADEVRRDRQRQVEAAARRLPVQLLFPLVLCILPAFALLTVAPLLAGALGSLRL